MELDAARWGDLLQTPRQRPRNTADFRQRRYDEERRQSGTHSTQVSGPRATGAFRVGASEAVRWVFAADPVQDNLASSPMAFPYAPQSPNQPRAFGTPSTNHPRRRDMATSPEGTPPRRSGGRGTQQAPLVTPDNVSIGSWSSFASVSSTSSPSPVEPQPVRRRIFSERVRAGAAPVVDDTTPQTAASSMLPPGSPTPARRESVANPSLSRRRHHPTSVAGVPATPAALRSDREATPNNVEEDTMRAPGRGELPVTPHSTPSHNLQGIAGAAAGIAMGLVASPFFRQAFGGGNV